MTQVSSLVSYLSYAGEVAGIHDTKATQHSTS